MARPGGRRQARVRRVRPGGWRGGAAGGGAGGWRQQEKIPQVAQRFAARGMPQAVIADLVEAGWQDVLEEAPDELVAGHGFLTLAVGGAVLVAIGHGLVVDGQDAVVGDGDTEGVAGEIVERGLLSLAHGVMSTTQGICQTWGARSASGQSLAKASRKRARARVASADLGKRKVLPAGCQVVPSSDNPPPVTRQ